MTSIGYRFQPAGQPLGQGTGMSDAGYEVYSNAVYAFTALGQIVGSESISAASNDDEMIAFEIDDDYEREDGYEGEIVVPGRELYREPVKDFLARLGECSNCEWAALTGTDGLSECCHAEMVRK